MEDNEIVRAENAESDARTKLTAKERGKKFILELKDMLIGAAFPFMLMLILSASIISYIAYSGTEELGMKILILVVGEVMVFAATVIFGRQNGATAYKKTLQNEKKRLVNSSDWNSRLYIGEYAPYKGAIIPLIACIPFMIFQLVQAVYPNDACRFALMYAFGWAYFPFNVANLSDWLNFLWVIPFAGAHLGAYIWGAKKEKKKLEQLNSVEEDTKKKK